MFRQLICATIGLACLAFCGVFLYASTQTYEVRLEREEIQTTLRSHFPLKKNLAAVFDFTFSNPTVTLTPGTDRIGIGIDSALNLQIPGQESPVSGHCDLTSGLYYDASSGQILLVDPIVDHIELEGVPEKLQTKATNLARQATESFFSRHLVYSVESQHPVERLTKTLVKDVKIQGEEVLLTLGL